MSGSHSRMGTAVVGFVGFIAVSALAGTLVAASVAPTIEVTGMAASTSVSLFDGLPDYLKIGPLPQTTTVYATMSGKAVPIATFYAQNRVGVKWNDVSQFAKDAAVATEDPRFYQEGGIDPIGTVRAALANMFGSRIQGASTITQQYVKNVLVQQCDAMPFNADAAPAVLAAQKTKRRACYRDAAGVTIPRKLREMRYAIGVDKRYSKDQILLGYLNIAGFGGSVYGIQAASEYYFGLSAKDLELRQAATLIAILNNPANLRIDQSKVDNPGNNAANGFARTLARRNYVLKRMLIHHKVTKDRYAHAVKTKIVPSIHPVQSGCMSANKYDAGFFCSYVSDIMHTDPVFGATPADRTALFNLGGMKVYTSLNLNLQAQAQAAISAYIPATDPALDLGSSNVTMAVGTGKVLSMVENKTFNNTAAAPTGTTSINYNTDQAQGGSAGFQTGSSFKAFDLTAWLEEGHTLYQTVDAPSSGHVFQGSQFPGSCTGGFHSPWQVANDAGEAGGRMTVLSATENSVNTAFAQMGTQSNVCDISRAAKKLLVHSASPQSNPWFIGPSMILGTNYISPLTMATAYAAFANHGVVCTPVAIDAIVMADGSHHAVPKSTCSQGVPANIATGVAYALNHVMTNGTATSANPNDGTEILGKTGTTDHSIQNWLVTSTTTVATATWVGNISGGVRLRSQYFHGINGGDVKFHIARPILAAVDSLYPAASLPTPARSLLYPPRPTRPSHSPTTPTAPAKPKQSQPLPSQSQQPPHPGLPIPTP
ncbi:MAG: penicillin-binding protein [Microbacteriaceae bacterium]|nr:MAG: penicillin-binding protein [Microbacteriaceae bacterium]